MKPFTYDLETGETKFSDEILELITKIHQNAIDEDKDPKTEFEAYTDKLIHEGKVGAAAVFSAAFYQKYPEEK